MSPISNNASALTSRPEWLCSGSGPRIARLYHRVLGCILFIAWFSLGTQIHLLIGSRGLLPIAPLAARVHDLGPGVWAQFPSWLILNPSDTALSGGIALGLLLAVFAICGVAPRLCLFLSAPLYLGYAVAGQHFTGFQWDNLLVESCVLATCLPRRFAAPVAHTLLRLLLFKIYFESGVAKAQSYLGDWVDGSAMRFYYETAPLPAWPGWYAHQLPELWHTIESWAALGLELGGAFLILGPRRARLIALVAFTTFQILNLATANYGYFVYLTLALHLFLLDDRDIDRCSRRLRSWNPLQRHPQAPPPSAIVSNPWLPTAVRHFVFSVFAAGWLVGSLATGIVHFSRPGPAPAGVQSIERATRPFRVTNAYHLFGHITRKRIEVDFQTQHAGVWKSQPLLYKPGDPKVPPSWVAPHQPRVDFLLWFYGLAHERPAPAYVTALLAQMCTDPEAVQPLFSNRLPRHPDAVRIEFWQYHFTSAEERQETGMWWTRERIGERRATQCKDFRRREFNSGGGSHSEELPQGSTSAWTRRDPPMRFQAPVAHLPGPPVAGRV